MAMHRARGMLAAFRNYLVLLALLVLLVPRAGLAQQPVSDQPFPALEAGMHTALIWRLALDRDGRYAVTASDDKTVRVWELASGRLLQTLRVPVGPDNEGRLFAVALSPDGKRVAVGGWTSRSGVDTTVYFFDRASGRLLGRITNLPNVVTHLAWSPDGRWLAIALGVTGGIRIHAATPPYTERARDTDYGDYSMSVHFDRSGRLVSTSYDGKLRLYGRDFRLVVPPRRVAGGDRPFSARFSPDGRRIAVGFEDSTAVSVVSGTDLSLLRALDTRALDQGDLSTVAWSADGLRLYAAGRSQLADGRFPIRVFDPASGRPTGSWPVSADTIMDLRPLADGRLVFSGAGPAWGIVDRGGRVEQDQRPPILDYRSQFDAFRLNTAGDRLAFAHLVWRADRWQEETRSFDLRTLSLGGGDTAPATDLAPPRLEGLPVKDWRNSTAPTLDSRPLRLQNYEKSRSLAIAADASHFALGTDWYVRWFDAAGTQQWERQVPAAAWLVNLSADGRYVVAGLGDGTVRWYRTQDKGSEALALFVYADGKRWVAWTPEGFFAASPDGEGLMGYVLNQGSDKEAEFVSAAQLHRQFYRPDLVVKRVAGDEATIRTALAQVGDVRQLLRQGLPPEVELLSEANAAVDGEYELRLRITPRGAGVGRMVLKVNGVEQQAGRDPAPIGGVYTQRLRYAPGVYKLEYAALDASNRMMSRSGTVNVQVRGLQAKPRLHVLAIGVSKAAYADNKLATDGVEFADRDARAFVDQLRTQAVGGNLYREVKTRLLTSRAETSLAAIDNALRETAAGFESGDTVVLFLAGHGKALDNKYHFLPSDLAVENEDSIRRASLTQTRLEERLRAFGTGRVLLILDTCHAGAMTESRGLEETFAIDNLMRQSGRAILAASKSDELAFQDRQRQHGIYTQALLDGLRQSDYDGDGIVDVEELTKYLLREVPTRSAKANPAGTRQTPMRSPTSNPWPLVPVLGAQR